MMETESAMNRVNRNRQKILPERNVTMKFFHLSDLHIGLKLMNRDLREDQEYILSKIVDGDWSECGDHDDQRKSRQCAEGQLFSKCFVQTEGIYDRSATENKGRIYRKSRSA